jgi:hypothetical protein
MAAPARALHCAMRDLRHRLGRGRASHSSAERTLRAPWLPPTAEDPRRSTHQGLRLRSAGEAAPSGVCRGALHSVELANCWSLCSSATWSASTSGSALCGSRNSARSPGADTSPRAITHARGLCRLAEAEIRILCTVHRIRESPERPHHIHARQFDVESRLIAEHMLQCGAWRARGGRGGLCPGSWR